MHRSQAGRDPGGHSVGFDVLLEDCMIELCCLFVCLFLRKKLLSFNIVVLVFCSSRAKVL